MTPRMTGEVSHGAKIDGRWLDFKHCIADETEHRDPDALHQALHEAVWKCVGAVGAIAFLLRHIC